ncbi:hypothetical protein M9458_044905, partial [Cirrhinus mrigala]
TSLHKTDGHSECVACLGSAHTEAALTGGSCSHYESTSLSCLRSRIAFFNEGGPPCSALPFPFPPKTKKQRSSGCATSAQRPRVPPFPHILASPVCFPLAASGIVSFTVSEEDVITADDSMSLAAEPEVLTPSQPARLKLDTELIHVLSKVVEDLGAIS